MPIKTKGERFPYFLSSFIWWKWEQNRTKVIDKAGPVPKSKDSRHGILFAYIPIGLSAISPAAKAKGPNANQHRGSPRPK